MYTYMHYCITLDFNVQIYTSLYDIDNKKVGGNF